MNGSKPSCPSGDPQFAGAVPALFPQGASPFPSPRLRGRSRFGAAKARPAAFRLRGAPKRRCGATAAGRGRILRWLSAQPSLARCLPDDPLEEPNLPPPIPSPRGRVAA